MKIFAIVAVIFVFIFLCTGCVRISAKFPVSRDRLASSLDIAEIGINVLFRFAEREGADVTAAREQSAAAFMFLRSLLVLEFRSIGKKDLDQATVALRDVASAAVRLCRAVEVDEEVILLHERYIDRAFDMLGVLLDVLPEEKPNQSGM